MKLRPALMQAGGPPGVWLIDEEDQPRASLTINGGPDSVLKSIAKAVIEALPEEIEVPDTA